MAEDLEHLLTECRADAELSPQESIELVKVDRWVAYARADAVLTHLNSLLHYPLHDRMPCMLLYGLPGVELHLTTGRELFEADFVYLITGKPL